jgi:hypothetical protein
VTALPERAAGAAGLSRAERRAATQRGLAFTAKLSALYKAGIRLRDDDSFEARAFLLAHAGRELRNRILEYIAGYAGRVVQPVDGPQVTQKIGKHWTQVVTPRIQSFADASGTTPDVEVPVTLALDLDPVMRHQADAEGQQFRRGMINSESLHPYIGYERASTIIRAMTRLKLHKYAHAQAKDINYPEAEAIDLWDRLEEYLFDLVGSAAWGFSIVDQTIEDLNSL